MIKLDSSEPHSPVITSFYDQNSNSFSYLVQDSLSKACAIIDAVMGFDYASGAVSFDGADEILAMVKQKGLEVELLIETHVHADHMSAAPYIQSKVGGKVAIGKRIVQVQHEFGKLFNEGTEFERDGSQFDILFEDDQNYFLGSLECQALYTPGHTPACMTHVIGDVAFVGDTLFMPDGGTARADFPGGDARTLYRSIQRVLSLPDETRLYMCHDYQPNGRSIEFVTTVAQQKEANVHLCEGVTEDQFVAAREARDATLNMPQLIYPSLQVNMRAGHFPEPEDNSTRYLKVPLVGLK